MSQTALFRYFSQLSQRRDSSSFYREQGAVSGRVFGQCKSPELAVSSGLLFLVSEAGLEPACP